MKRRTSMRPRRKVVEDKTFWNENGWVVVRGRLKRGQGHPGKVDRLFEFVADKLPYESLHSVGSWMEKNAPNTNGVYLAHDSMGTARYGGRGQIFNRLKAHKKIYPRELVYYSFYIIRSKNHEREIETVILRSAGPQLILNQRKVRDDIDRGNVRDFEAGTEFFERQRKKGSGKRKNGSRPKKRSKRAIGTRRAIAR